MSKDAETTRRDRQRVMACRLMQFLGLSKADRFEELPVRVREYLDSLEYSQIVKPLILSDHHNGLKIKGLCIKYGLSDTAIRHHLKK